MNAEQSQIAELIAKLPPEERRELLDHLLDANLFGDGDSLLTQEQQHIVAQRMAEADRGETIPSEQVWAQLAEKYGFRRS